MKANRDNSKPIRREIFILTSEEKKTVCFVLVAAVLGLATKYYRDRHPAPLPKVATAAGRESAVRKPSPASRPRREGKPQGGALSKPPPENGGLETAAP